MHSLVHLWSQIPLIQFAVSFSVSARSIGRSSVLPATAIWATVWCDRRRDVHTWISWKPWARLLGRWNQWPESEDSSDDCFAFSGGSINNGRLDILLAVKFGASQKCVHSRGQTQGSNHKRINPTGKLHWGREIWALRIFCLKTQIVKRCCYCDKNHWWREIQATGHFSRKGGKLLLSN